MDYKQYKDTVYKIIGAAMSVQIPDKTKTIQNPLKKRVVDTTPVVSVVESMML